MRTKKMSEKGLGLILILRIKALSQKQSTFKAEAVSERTPFAAIQKGTLHKIEALKT